MMRTIMKFGICTAIAAAAPSAHADIISGTITNWVDLNESFPPFTPQIIGDDAHHVTAMWSLGSWDLSDTVADSGYFYGSVFNSDTEVAAAVGISNINQVTDASIFAFTDTVSVFNTPALFDAERASGIGDFVVLRNNDSGHYALVRIDDVYDPHTNARGRLCARLDLTWWFQTDGSANFTVPAPTPLAMIGALAGLATRRRHRVVT